MYIINEFPIEVTPFVSPKMSRRVTLLPLNGDILLVFYIIAKINDYYSYLVNLLQLIQSRATDISQNSQIREKIANTHYLVRIHNMLSIVKGMHF